MRLTFLGIGTSGGVPFLGCYCAVRESTDPYDKRLRTAALLETQTTRILIDCGPDIHQQFMPSTFTPLDGVLLMHTHYDHMVGIDDLRPFRVFGSVYALADQQTVDQLHQTMPYCFMEKLYPGVPRLDLTPVVPHQPLIVGDVEVLPFQVMYDKLPILGYRFGSLAYITDMKIIDDTEYAYLEGIDTLVMNALRYQPQHHSHMTVDEVVAFTKRIGAHRTYSVHMNHDVGFHEEVNKQLPAGMQLAYDGLQVDV